MALDKVRIIKSVRKLRRFLKKARRQPSPSAIHGFRTHTRRFESTLEALAMTSRLNEQHLLRDLSRLRKRAGKIRDLDVLTASAATVKIDGEQNCTVQLLEQLGAERSRHAKRMQTLVEKYGSTLRRRIERTRVRLRKSLVRNDSGPTDKRPHGSVAAMATALNLSFGLREPVRLNSKNLHSFRLKVKELRNVLQMSETADHQPFVEKLGAVKDAIGDWHDSEELVAVAAEVLKHRNCKLLRALKQSSHDKFQHARSLAYGLRKAYLPGQTNRAHTRGSQPLSRPVLVAASEVAD
jgi:CHAD domain-containing protein